MQKEIKQSWFFKQTPQEVWEYLTKSELIEQWLMKTDFQPITGHKFHFTFTPKTDSKYDGIVQCEVLEVKPFSKLSYSWNGSSNSGNRAFNSKVVWILVPKENGTELHLQHNGFILSEDVFNHTTGWTTCLKRFEELINTIKK
jgi:uncharacterized protein YndB with AHSA1/START domain